MKSNDLAWFKPLWRRVAVTLFLAVWCAWEWINGEAFWGVLTGAALVYAVANFFVTFPKNEPENKDIEP